MHIGLLLSLLPHRDIGWEAERPHRISYRVAYWPDGTMIASGWADHSVRIRDAATGSQPWELKGDIDPF
jgi:WD40 repeat protein